MGTDCQNQPEVHLLRAGAARADPAGRARPCCSRPRRSSRPDELVHVPRRARPLPAGVRPGLPQPAHGACCGARWPPGTRGWPRTRCRRHAARCRPATAWVTYVRCHDDIGWAVDRRRTRPRSAWTAYAHRRFLSDFYAGRVPRLVRPRRAASRRTRPPATPGSPAPPPRCAASRPRWRPVTGPGWPPRSAGCVLLYAVAFSFGGIPLIYMGDELGLRNDHSWSRDPAQRRRQPVDAPPADGLGRRGPAARPVGPGRAGVRGPGRAQPGPPRAARAALGRADRGHPHRAPQRAGLPAGAPAQRARSCR